MFSKLKSMFKRKKLQVSEKVIHKEAVRRVGKPEPYGSTSKVSGNSFSNDSVSSYDSSLSFASSPSFDSTCSSSSDSSSSSCDSGGSCCD